MWGSTDDNFFDEDDEDFLSLKLDDFEYVQTASPSKYSAPEKLPLKKKRNEIPKAENTLSTFLHKFDFQPRADVIADTLLETIVKDGGKFTDKSYDTPHPKDHESDLPNKSNSIMRNNGKCEPVFSPNDDISFDVCFDENCDFTKSVDDSQSKNAELSNRLHDETVKCVEILSNRFPEASPSEELLSFSPNKSMNLNESMKKDNDENCLVLLNPSTSADLFEKLLCHNKKTIMSLKEKNLEFRALNLKSPDLISSSEISKLSANCNSDKARKRKFPGPAGLLPDIPPRSPLVLKQHEYSLEVDPKENSSDQEFLYSQSSRDDFLCASWSVMINELTSCDNLILLKKFNIKSVRKQASKKKLPKYVEVPFLCVLLKSFMVKDGEVIVIFKDETGEISGKIYQEVFDKHRDSLQVGATIVLKKATFLLDQLGIKLANIIRIYDTNGNKICVNDWNDIQEMPFESILSRSCSEPPPAVTDKRNSIKQQSNSYNKDQEIQDYIVDFVDDSLFEDDLNEIVSTLDEDSFIV